jgi:tetratricopeptide (TPR) repeat protein
VGGNRCPRHRGDFQVDVTNRNLCTPASATLWCPGQASMIWLLALQLAVGPAQHYENAKLDFSQRKFPEAVSEVNAALHESPYMVPALILKARLAVFAHRPEVAKSCLITAITADPTSEEAQFFLGLYYYNQNEFKFAISPLQTAHTLSPKSPLPVFYLAMTHEAMGDTTQALDLYQQAEDLSTKKSPLSASILVAYGRLLLSLGRSQDSLEKDRRAVEEDPESREARYELARRLDYEGDFKNAALEGERALTLPEIGATDAQIHFLLAKLYWKLKQPDLAKAHLGKYQVAPQTAQLP